MTWLSNLASDGIILCIEERLDSKPTSGGSTFSVYSEHLAKELCNYRDMFNGTYLVWCPPVAPKGRRDITVKLQFVNYGAYAGSQVNINRYLWNHLIKLNSKKPLTPVKQPQFTSALDELMNTKNAVIWYLRNERWFVKLANGNHFFPLSTERMCACARNVNRIILAGTSHMKYNSTILSIRATNLGKTLRVTSQAYNIRICNNIKICFLYGFNSLIYRCRN